ncbi:ceramide synthase-like, partial [Scyliorhinus torazame]|uniref:ceramide synthase-like n=1 Tax=Scyliorhinus torazame TaxID=75743 RepID=UPI003B5C6573
MAFSLTEMLSELALGCLLFPGLFTLSKRCLKKLPLSGWGESDAVIVSTRIVSTVQAVMASSAGIIIVKSCSRHVLEDRHWLTNAYVLFAVPYFAYDIYAMYLCHWYKYKVKGHDVDRSCHWAIVKNYLKKELLMIIHHSVMFAVCFPVSV